MKNIFLAVACLVISMPLAFAQQNPPSPEEQEKKLSEFIQKEVDRLEMTLKLEDWQVLQFSSLTCASSCSILNHDYRAMQEEMNNLSSAKVSNFDIYTRTSDKWAENIYVAFRKVLNDNQWDKYLKNGAARDKKAREKRKAKMEKSSAKLQEND